MFLGLKIWVRKLLPRIIVGKRTILKKTYARKTAEELQTTKFTSFLFIKLFLKIISTFEKCIIFQIYNKSITPNKNNFQNSFLSQCSEQILLFNDFIKHILFQKYTGKLEKIPVQPEDEMELIPKIPPGKRFVDQSCDCSDQISYERGENNKQEL